MTTTYTNTAGLKFRATGKTRKHNRSILYEIEFFESGYKRYVPKSRLVQNSPVKDRLAKTVFGVGCLGTKYGKGSHKKLYQCWQAMLDRVYNPTCKAYTSYGAKGVTIDESWLNFTTFVDDVSKLPGYSWESLAKGEITLDKDLKQRDIEVSKRIYSKTTCTWISRGLNTSIAAKNQDKDRAKLRYLVTDPQGNVTEVFGLRAFAREYRLSTGNLSKVLNGTARHTKGYVIRRIEA